MNDADRTILRSLVWDDVRVLEAWIDQRTELFVRRAQNSVPSTSRLPGCKVVTGTGGGKVTECCCVPGMGADVTCPYHGCAGRGLR